MNKNIIANILLGLIPVLFFSLLFFFTRQQEIKIKKFMHSQQYALQQKNWKDSLISGQYNE